MPWQQDRPVRNNNPGDLRPRSGLPNWPGQVSVDNGPGGPFAIFNSAAQGWAALALWCRYASEHLHLTTASEMISVFAPPSENNTRAYIAGVEKLVGTGPLDLSSLPMRTALCKAIARWEDSRAFWEPGMLASGMRQCDVYWPSFSAALRSRQSRPPGVLENPGSTAPAAAQPSTADDLNLAELNRVTPAKPA